MSLFGGCLAFFEARFLCERSVLVQYIVIVVDGRCFTFQVLFDCQRVPLVAHPVRGPGFDGLQPSGQFVLSLGSALENGDIALNAKIDGLCVAGFEMQARDEPHRSPIAARSEEHTSELQSLMRISYAVFCLKKKKKKKNIVQT